MKSKDYKYTKYIYIPCDSLMDKLFSKKIVVYINKAGIKFCAKTFLTIPFERKIWKKIRDEHFDKYILEGGGHCFNFGFLRKKIPTDKFYVHIHGELRGNKVYANWFARCITVSNYIARRLTYSGVVDYEKVDVLPNCFDPILTQNDAASTVSKQIREKFGLAPSDFVFVYWGRLVPEKGVYELLQAFSIFCDKVSNAKLLIVGNATFGKPSFGAYDQKLKLLYETEQLKNRVIFTGFVPHEQIGNILRLCDVGVLPSIGDDPAPLTVFEALAVGLPLITTRVGGIPEIIKDLENGLLIDWTLNLKETLSDKMLMLYKDEKLRQFLSSNAKKSIIDYTSSSYYSKFVSLME